MANVKAVTITADNGDLYLIDAQGQLWFGEWKSVDIDGKKQTVIVWRVANLPEEQPA